MATVGIEVNTRGLTMRATLMALLLGLAGCGTGFDLSGLTDPADATRRGAIEATVKGQHPAILTDIGAGEGPALSAAYDTARVPLPDRATRTIQLQGDLGLYAANPGALVAALAAWGTRT